MVLELSNVRHFLAFRRHGRAKRRFGGGTASRPLENAGFSNVYGQFSIWRSQIENC